MSSVCVCVRAWSAVLLEVPHFASLRDAGREVYVLRSDNGISWYEHQTPVATEDNVSAVLAKNFDSKCLTDIRYFTIALVAPTPTTHVRRGIT